MQLPLRSGHLLLACAAAFAALAAEPVAAGAADAAPQVYVKKDTWAETILATRTALVRSLGQETKRPTAQGAKPFVSGPIKGDGPGQQVSVSVKGCQWLRLVTVVERGGGNCHIWGDARLVAADGTETLLGTLKPAAISVGWGQLLVDQNWQDHPLRIGKKEFKHGIWVHANSDVAYRIDGRYERFEAWAGMDADRATGVARFKVLFQRSEPVPLIWGRLRRDFPVHARWLTEDSRRGRELAWLTAKDARPFAALIQKPLRQLGAAGAPLRKSLDALRKAKAPADDRRWLDLYVRTHRYALAHAQLSRVWVADLRAVLARRFDELLGPEVPPDDPRWEQRTAALARLVPQLPKGRDVDPTAMRASIDVLAKALPGRLSGTEALLARLDAAAKLRQALCAAVVAGKDPSAEQVASLGRDLAALRREFLLALPAMREFLAVPAHAGLEAEWDSLFATLRRDIANRARFARFAAETHRPEALIAETDRDPADVVLRRAAALLADLQRTPAAHTLTPLEKQLADLHAASQAIEPQHAEARYALFAAACRLRRRIAFANPLLDFDKLLFLKRHRSSFNHMCDQYYAVYMQPGGGFFVLDDPFGPDPKARDILAGSVVESGRLKGSKLEGGSFVSPDLSFDARSVAFAYVECQGERGHDHHTDPSRGHWAVGRCYHVFKARIDGTGLQQLTDGTWNDFDPCWMPSGRIAFTSERRGGYLRCGRVCPTYTLFDMAPDGSDIRCLSYHETNEWHPSVAHDGRIVWTRWDYVDRHGVVAHMPWTTTPDGRDPRPIHGNYAPRPTRPDMELDVRAIPGSRKYVATAAPHHGQAFGSLILIDPRAPDDDGMAPVRRITPDVTFPESQGGAQAYGTPWPLSEDYFLCVYDPDIALRKRGAPGRYAIYLLDSFGNRELIYRDPDIACNNPIPLRPRPAPPVIPDASEHVPADKPAEAVVGVVNVYDSKLTWPEGTKIKALRIYQVLPLSVASAAVAHNTGLQIPQGHDSINIARAVLGTVPVEPDGSASFIVPARKELFFQALDKDGLAITSMRSGTHFQPGEKAVCQGCHEPRQGTSWQPPAPDPIALRRAPSRPKPDVDGTHPFSYPRLVQPVLERHCVACHTKNPKKAPRLDAGLVKHPGGGWMNKPTTYYASYVSLAPNYGFYDYRGRGWTDPKWYRTTPGQFGARASKLYQMLVKGHNDLKLPPEDLHRIAVWLDSCSLFYGVYEKEGGLAQLRGEVATPTLE